MFHLVATTMRIKKGEKDLEDSGGADDDEPLSRVRCISD